VRTTQNPGPLYFNMHDDEQTSVMAAAAVLESSGGSLYELVHSGNRYVEFHYDSTLYAFDPKRIYTDAGVWHEVRRVFDKDSVEIAESLHLLHSQLVNAWEAVWVDVSSTKSDTLMSWLTDVLDRWFIPKRIPPFELSLRDTMAFYLIRDFADTLISIMQIDSQQLVIALHNNKEFGYSMSSYRIDSIYADEALAIYIGLHHDPDDFYFVTDRRLFEALQPSYYHIVLQDNKRMTDDGSLSVYCGQRGIPYVNIEAQHGHLFDQHSMLHYLIERLIPRVPE